MYVDRCLGVEKGKSNGFKWVEKKERMKKSGKWKVNG
jgi:hypothetical protein